ncbi:hypothetical protein ISF_01581 [Cordyceps fumosorosea ARSEF 2679]|uniref:Uncharacterized protein n=1 Tax=Cordyceps fumosorosea (strain ARSEF 2679) TaxID=1081104 RepID=A0A168DEG0_CORFA|nr:hypothetical protein ISF_01581 [Cordyceps fumosorosea ARSEF 2679]OAA72508.1 hypothetical protein ISF_01581 [Cordyceps fumosorosea ARSEF 2679]
MQPPSDRPYKTHLDEVASHQIQDYREPSTIQKAAEKISEYIPAAAGPLQHLTGHPPPTKTAEAEEAPAPDPSQLPERPVHDEHIENFVREQHRQDGSKILEGHRQ